MQPPHPAQVKLIGEIKSELNDRKQRRSFMSPAPNHHVIQLPVTPCHPTLPNRHAPLLTLQRGSLLQPGLPGRTGTPSAKFSVGTLPLPACCIKGHAPGEAQQKLRLCALLHLASDLRASKKGREYR